MNLYLIKFKVDQIKQAAYDYGKPINGFTRKLFFYFFIDNNIKYIHKQSLFGVYTNAFTYSDEEDTPNYCRLNDKPIKDTFKPILDWIVKGNSIIPKVNDSEHFISHKVMKGEVLNSLTQDQFFELKEYDGEYTPFYNSMCYNLIDTVDGIKVLDMKHFELRDDKPFFIYMYNEDHGINKLYVESNTQLKPIFDHLNKDYYVTKQDVIYYEQS